MIITKEIFPLVCGEQNYLENFKDYDFLFQTVNVPHPIKVAMEKTGGLIDGKINIDLVVEDSNYNELLLKKNNLNESVLNNLNSNYRFALKNFLIGFYIKLQDKHYSEMLLQEIFWQTNPYFLKGYLTNIDCERPYAGKGFDNPIIRKIRREDSEVKAHSIAKELSAVRDYSLDQILNDDWKKIEGWKGLSRAYSLLNNFD